MNVFLFSIALLGEASQPWPETWVDRFLPDSTGEGIKVSRSGEATANQCEDAMGKKFHGGTVIFDELLQRESVCQDDGENAYWANTLLKDLGMIVYNVHGERPTRGSWDFYYCWVSCRGEDRALYPYICNADRGWCSVLGEGLKDDLDFGKTPMWAPSSLRDEENLAWEKEQIEKILKRRDKENTDLRTDALRETGGAKCPARGGMTVGPGSTQEDGSTCRRLFCEDGKWINEKIWGCDPGNREKCWEECSKFPGWSSNELSLEDRKKCYGHEYCKEGNHGSFSETLVDFSR